MGKDNLTASTLKRRELWLEIAFSLLMQSNRLVLRGEVSRQGLLFLLNIFGLGKFTAQLCWNKRLMEHRRLVLFCLLGLFVAHGIGSLWVIEA